VTKVTIHSYYFYIIVTTQTYKWSVYICCRYYCKYIVTFAERLRYIATCTTQSAHSLIIMYYIYIVYYVCIMYYTGCPIPEWPNESSGRLDQIWRQALVRASSEWDGYWTSNLISRLVMLSLSLLLWHKGRNIRVPPTTLFSLFFAWLTYVCASRVCVWHLQDPRTCALPLCEYDVSECHTNIPGHHSCRCVYNKSILLKILLQDEYHILNDDAKPYLLSALAYTLCANKIHERGFNITPYIYRM